MNGARQVEVTINGIGERAGNTALEEVVMALYTHPKTFPVYSHIDTQQIFRTSQLVANKTGMAVQANKAIVGANAFAHESGIHQDGVLKHQATYEIINPSVVGVPSNSLVLGKHSGRNAFRTRLTQLGYHLSEAEFQRAFERVNQLLAALRRSGHMGPSKPWQYARTRTGHRSARAQGPAGDVLLNLVQRWWTAFTTIESRFGHLLFKTNVGSTQGHPLSPHSTSGMGASASWSAGDSAPFTMTPSSASPGAAFQGISMARYSWPEHEMDQASLLDMLRALDLGRPSASLSRITRRRSSGHLQLVNMPPPGPADSGIGGNTPAGRSPKTPTFAGMVDNFGATIESVPPKAPSPTPAAIVTGASASVASPTSPVHSLHGANAELAAPFMFAGGSAAGEMTSAVDRALDSSPMPTSAVARSVELTQESPVIKPLATRDVFSREPSAAAIATTTSKAAPTTATTKTTAAPAKPTTAAPAPAKPTTAAPAPARAAAPTASAPAPAKATNAAPAPAKATAAAPAPTKASAPTAAAANASAPAKTSSAASPASPSGTSTTAATKGTAAPQRVPVQGV
ncbi:hypothetical protein AMAG_18561 [Allomyces macrogynus ATCC 38327]|uniref:Pyruvate carboxyltransferase domain-containing protein n=1 Tax=Allomyces macrogynus (strain ATCC 38327) TaxID=578462 RepID=A0A0L0SDS8_ALLM3|nr:hypothetical protein AMAG_18561 [Allomyces macrogynus ATCC 38327]|eukprot:KNE60587.1 hypothetical protein AMAG_18561 [Allomyces macrogynus ATCC 38327]